VSFANFIGSHVFSMRILNLARSAKETKKATPTNVPISTNFSIQIELLLLFRALPMKTSKDRASLGKTNPSMIMPT